MKTPIIKQSLFAVALLLLVLCVNQASGQSLSLFDLDISNFPTIKAKFIAFDKDINLIRPTQNELIVSENGINREITNLNCPMQNPERLSVVLLVDVTIYNNLKNAKNVLLSWIDMLEIGTNEVALVSFDGNSYINQDFTTDRNRLESAINNLQTLSSSEDHTGAMIRPLTGGISVAEKGKYKKVVLLLSSCSHFDKNSISMIIQKANQSRVTLNFVIFDNYDYTSDLCKEMSFKTGGFSINNIPYHDLEKAKNALHMIYQVAQNGDPCEIVWESGISCKAGLTNVELQILDLGLKAITSYKSPIETVAKLEFNPPTVKFLNPEIGVKVEKKVTITARNANFNVTSIIGSNAAFTISPSNFVLYEEESRELTVSYTPTDSGYNNCKFEIESEPCTMTYYASGGYKGKKPTVQTLKLTHPNGGETFVVGSDTVITWEGILPSDKVHLEYSNDNGQNWQIITKNASGLTYNWTNVPKPSSNQCLVRVSQGGVTNDSDPDNPAPQIEWQKTFGGSDVEGAYFIQETRDNGFIVASSTLSNDGDINENKGDHDIWILKLRFDGSIEWQKTYGGSEGDFTNYIQQTRDDGYIVAGTTWSIDGDLTDTKGNGNIWIFKLNRDGDIEWQKKYGGSSGDDAKSIQETRDGGYIVSGDTFSNDGDITENKGLFDIWVFKLSIDGNIEWQKTYGGSESDYVHSVKETSDGGYIVAGYTDSDDGDIAQNKGVEDIWVLKLSSNGNIEWQKTYGGSGRDVAFSIQQTIDGGYVISANTISKDGDVTENKGQNDMWVLKLSNSGNIEWQKTYGGSNNDFSTYIQELRNGGYIMVGYTWSNDGDLSENKGNSDICIMKLKLDGSLEWQKTYGGSLHERAYFIQETDDGDYIVAGYTESLDSDVTENKGKGDLWIIKVQSDGSLEWQQTYGGSNNDDSRNIQETSDKGYIVAGYTKSNDGDVTENKGLEDFWVIKLAVGATVLQSDISDAVFYIVEPHLQKINNLIDFGDVPYQSHKDSLRIQTIKNVSNSPITITSTKHNYPNIVDFSTINGEGSFTLQPGETHLMDLRFAPSSLGRTSGTLEFHYDGVGSPAIVQLFGNGQLEPKILSFSPLCVGDLLYLFTNEVHKGQYHWMGPNGFTSDQQYIIIPNAQLHHSGRYSLYVEIEGTMTDTTHFDVLVNENIVTPNDENLVFLGNTKRDDLHIELTEAFEFNLGAVWMKEKLSFKKDFFTEFKFNYTDGDNGGMEETSLPGAGGLAFVILNEFNPSLGEQGDDIGYTGFRNSLAIEIDLFRNPYDPNGNHIAIQSLGPEPNTADHSIKESTLAMNKNIMLLEQDSVYYVRIAYNYALKRLNIYLNNERMFTEPVLTLDDIDLPEYLSLEDGEFGYVGFTSATGRAFQVHNINDWIVPCKNSPLSVYNTPKSNQGIVRISPNPSENMLEIDLQLNEEGQTELLIYNMQGEKVKELFKQTIGTLGAQSLKCDISDLSSGHYYLVLITPTYITTKNLIIMR
ncbi:MAG: hypothetical protein CVV22_11185 [Ignavibacteriae bacterium HGW-Ignavibacteriae-1]|jgi:hypothetical protein|nr:MAG: hypothetical protein CVV22_11185 [Ignavibacteriae bacterium HGW-Ignavibacteriae-1]